MSESTKLILAGGAFVAVWYLFLRPVPVALASATVAPPLNPYGALAGYAPQPNYPTNPNDRNNAIYSMVAGLANLGAGIAGAVGKQSSASQSTGQFNGGYSAQSDVPDGWSNDMPSGW